MSNDYWRARNGYLPDDPSSGEALRGYHDRQQASGGGFSSYNDGRLDVTKPLDDYLARSSKSSWGPEGWGEVLGGLAPIVIILWAYAASGPTPSSKTQTAPQAAKSTVQITTAEDSYRRSTGSPEFDTARTGKNIYSEEDTKELQKLFSRPFSKIYGEYTQGSLCKAFSAYQDTCEERTAGWWRGVHFEYESGASLAIATFTSKGQPQSHLHSDVLVLEAAGRAPAKIDYYLDFRSAALQAMSAFGMQESDLEACYQTGSSVGKDEKGKDFSCRYFPPHPRFKSQLSITHRHVEQEQKVKAAEAQESRDDLEPSRKRMETAFAQSSIRMFGDQMPGGLCNAFRTFPVTCMEKHPTEMTVVDNIASKSVSVLIINRAENSDLVLTVRRSSDDSAAYTLIMEGPGGNDAVRKYDLDLRAVAASVLDRFGLVSLDILNRCSDPPRDFTSTVNGNRVSCRISTAARMTATISISGKEPSP